MKPKTYKQTAPTSAPTAHSTHDGRVDTLDNMTDLEQVMTFPWVRMGDYQAFQEQKQGMSVLLRRILMSATDTDRDTPFFLGILRAASEIDDDLTAAMRGAREGKRAKVYRQTNERHDTNRQAKMRFGSRFAVTKRNVACVLAVRTFPSNAGQNKTEQGQE